MMKNNLEKQSIAIDCNRWRSIAATAIGGNRLLSIAAAVAVLAALPALAADAGFTLGIPGAPKMRTTADAAGNAWLAKNATFTAMSCAATETSRATSTLAGAEGVTLAAAESGFAIERTKPEYYLGDEILPPDGVDWSATYARYVADAPDGFLFDTVGERVFATEGGTIRFTWILEDGTPVPMSYVASASCSGRPRRIYWTDDPYNAPSIDLTGKFVKFFGSEELLKTRYGAVTNVAGGVEQVITNAIVSGLVLDSASHMLYAHGNLQGQVVMAYYDTGTYERMLHVQAVEICRPAVNIMQGEIGTALRADGRGYGTDGLRPRPTVVSPTDGRGEYLYQHKGRYSYSPKNGNVYPLRPTKDCRWNAEVYWMETDEMEVQWPFELDHYECDWPADATVFVRGDVAGDGGRPIYVPSDYTASLMDYQEPDGHARAPASDGTFESFGEGYSLLRLTTEDDIWFVPVHSVFRSNIDYFTLLPQDIRVGRELKLRGGAVAGTAVGFEPQCDADSPGYIYKAASGTHYNARLYQEPKADSAVSTEVSGTDTNTYASVVYAVRPDGADGKGLEVWWNTTIQQEDMPAPLTIPTLPQVYSVRWPKAGETPQIVIASQLGSASKSLFSHNAAAYLSREDATAPLAERKYFDASDGGTVMFWVRNEVEKADEGALVTLVANGSDGTILDSFTLSESALGAIGYATKNASGATDATPLFGADWHHVAVAFSADGAWTLFLDGSAASDGTSDASGLLSAATLGGSIGACDAVPSVTARVGAEIGELCLWNKALTAEEIAEEMFKTHTGSANHLTGCYTIVEGTDLAVSGTDERVFTEKVLGTRLVATKVLLEENGPLALGTGVFDADSDTTPTIYAQNDASAVGYNPNEEHAVVFAGSGGYVAWALRCDLNTDESSAPGVLVEYVKDGRKAMQWFDVAVTNSVYPELAADCCAGKAFPGPHPIDFFDDPWLPEDTWDEPSLTSPVHRDRKGQLWARAAGTATMRMFYPMQEGFAFPDIDAANWPKIGEAVPWLSCLGAGGPHADAMTLPPAAWTWRVAWPEVVPEIEIGRTLTVAASGLPEVWNAKSVGVVWPATDADRAATALLFDPTVAQKTGFSDSDYPDVASAIADLGIKVGAGGNATLRKGKYYFDGLPPSISSRFYVDTTAAIGSCIRLEGEQEDNAGGVSLLHVNVPNAEEREALASILDKTASEAGKTKWRAAIGKLATAPVAPSPHEAVSDVEERVAYAPRDHYALFTMGATNYVTLVENDSTNELMNVSEGDPISMHLVKVVPKYYTGRVVTREDPINLLSQQLSVIYAEAFAGKPEDYIFEWKKCRPHANGTVPTDFEGEYTAKFEPTAGLTRFVIGAQGDTLANMVNTYYAMRYRAASESSPAYAAMGYEWSDWTDPPALAEGWVQRVLNNVTPFAQRMRDLAENEAETAVSMIRQAGGPFEGDVALSQDNLTEVGLIQLYETILDKAESMSLQLGIDDADANKQLQLAVARLADLYNVLGDEAYTDALNPTIGFGANFNTPEKCDLNLEYGALSSSLFAFDNQVPTLLDEELALLRGRSGENAPSTHLSPYYNRLVWNFTRGMSAGEVAYAVNYDISGNGKGVIDYSQAAEMYPQGHGDAYGHYLSGLSGYYRLLRNPFFSWGEPAMGEMVVADSVLNVDYYDEAQFAKSAYNVAKVALEATDRTARKAYRDNAGAAGAGYLDSDATRNFGYGEWASRGGFGALANWAVANSLLAPQPVSGDYLRLKFTGDDYLPVYAVFDEAPATFASGGRWTIECQIVPDAEQPEAEAYPVMFGSSGIAAGLLLKDNKLSFEVDRMREVVYTNLVTTYTYTNVVSGAIDWQRSDNVAYATVAFTNSPSAHAGCRNDVVAFRFVRGAVADALAPSSDALAEIAASLFASDDPSNAPAVLGGWGYVKQFSRGENDELTERLDTQYVEGRTLDYDADPELHVIEICKALPASECLLVAIRCDGGAPYATVFDSSGSRLAREELSELSAFSLSPEYAVLGSFYAGEASELRVWDGVVRTDAELLAKRDYVSPLADGLALYLRTDSTDEKYQLQDEADASVSLFVLGGDWIEERESGMDIDFEDEGLNRIDRSTVSELAALASIVPQIQTKVDQMDAGLNPLGLASGAIPFDLTPINAGDESKSHYEQIRERADTALANARAMLERAQTAGNRLRLLQEAQVGQTDALDTMELETKNKLIEYFGYPYEGDIGPGGTYPQGYDGPDVYHYAWMDPAEYGLDKVDSTASATISVKTKPNIVNIFVPFLPSSKTESQKTLDFELSATGFVLKPSNISGKRRAQGKIQDALADFIIAYASFKSKTDNYNNKLADFESGVTTTWAFSTAVTEVKAGFSIGGSVMEYVEAGKKAALNCAVNNLEVVMDSATLYQNMVLDATPGIVGAGMTVNTDPKAIAGATSGPAYVATYNTLQGTLLAAKNSLAILEAGQSWTQIAKGVFSAIGEAASDRIAKYGELRDLWYGAREAAGELNGAYRELQKAQAAVETVVAEAERVIDERTLARSQAVDSLTKARYHEMFARLERNNALTRYTSAFDLAQKYAYLAAQAYDYETGLLSADPKSGEAFVAEIVGARTLGEFDADGTPVVTSGNGDGGLADILARLDANWLVLKPRLGINNPQPYATWFSLRHELFRLYADERGDKAWKKKLRECVVDDLNAIPEFRHYCQPLAGSTAEKEPGIVIPFPSQIAFGQNFFGKETVGGDSPLDSTYYATRISAAGVHFEGYNEAVDPGRDGARPSQGASGGTRSVASSPLAKTPVCYLVPVGEDRMRAVGDMETVLSWRVVDQTIPAPYAIGSTQLDDPDWTPLYDGVTGGNDLGARIRKHPSFRAYYGASGEEPDDAELDCTRLVGRSAWNTRWLLIIPAGAMNADREAALDAFIDGADTDLDGRADFTGVSDIRLGLKTYSTSGN